MAEDSPAQALARLRWVGVSRAARAEHGRMMARTRWAQVRLLQEAEAALRRVNEVRNMALDLSRLNHYGEDIGPPPGENRPTTTPVDPKV